jgi:C_GCAxxG_C_C family probable redox protein
VIRPNDSRSGKVPAMATAVPEVVEALATFDQGFNCAQAVLSVFAGRHGLSRDHALKLACPFGSGMMRAETCGAVTGALLVIGLAHGRAKSSDLQARSRTYALAQAFQERFHELHGTCNCSELLGLDPTTPEGRQAALDRGLFESRCPLFVQSAVTLVQQLVYPPTEP